MTSDRWGALESFSLFIPRRSSRIVETDCGVLRDALSGKVLISKSSREVNMCRLHRIRQDGICKWSGLLEVEDIWVNEIPARHTYLKLSGATHPVVKILLAQNNWFSNEESFFRLLLPPSSCFFRCWRFKKSKTKWKISHVLALRLAYMWTCIGRERSNVLTGVIGEGVGGMACDVMSCDDSTGYDWNSWLFLLECWTFFWWTKIPSKIFDQNPASCSRKSSRKALLCWGRTDGSYEKTSRNSTANSWNRQTQP